MSVALNELKDWVGWESGGQNRGESTVLLHVTHSNLAARMFEIRLDRHMTVESVKEKLRKHTGTGSLYMHLTLLDDNSQVVADLSDDGLMLGYFSPLDGYTLHITDLDPHSLSAGGGLEDVSLVKKYEISETDYLNREDNFRRWKEDKKKADPGWSFAREIKDRQDAQRLKRDPSFVPEPWKERESNEDAFGDLAAGMKVGDRCEVTMGGKRGEVKYVGKIPALAAGWWVGVQYDEPVGKNDGAITSKLGRTSRFFECPPNYGGFLRPDKLLVGDYPERDLFDESEEEADGGEAGGGE